MGIRERIAGILERHTPDLGRKDLEQLIESEAVARQLALLERLRIPYSDEPHSVTIWFNQRLDAERKRLQAAVEGEGSR